MRIYILSFLIICTYTLSAQNLRLELPAHAGKEVKLSVRRGMVSDTIMQVKLNKSGVAVINYSALKASAGLATITIKPDVNYEFVLSPTESATIHSSEQVVNPGNTKISNSPENRSIDSLFSRLMLLKQKQKVLRPVVQMYNATSTLGVEARNEQKYVDNALQLFYDSIKLSPLYGAKFIEVRQLVNEQIENAWQLDSLKTLVRDYILHRMDINFVYGSGMYFNLFNGLNMYVYQKESIYHKEFGNDMVQILKRTEPLDIYTTLATDMLTVCEKLCWNVESEKIVDYLIESKRIINPVGKLNLFMYQFKLRVGKPAPRLLTSNSEITFNKAKQGTIIIFYETGCSYCDTELKGLIADYAKYQKKGLQIVTVSADHDQAIFDKNSQDFPWKNKLCDLKGMGGQNFQNYGVMGTPTIYFVDKKGVIRAKGAKLEEVLKDLKSVYI